MSYMWSKDLETGNQVIDTQHKQLIESFNNFLEACSSGKGQQEINKTMDFLVAYTGKHFADEEGLQVQYKYPEYENHKKMHDDFKKLAQGLSEQLKKEGATISLVTKASSSIGNWLRNHIIREDKKVAAYLKNQQS